jgi:TetR/AcrR family transcriptional regulator, regulator of autoinduction and epiphytic fitness
VRLSYHVGVVAATTASVDGRVQRGERTRGAIADALLALLEGGRAQPTAREIAAAAGVSLRSVFQHFDDMEALYAVCVELQHERVAALRIPIDERRSRAERIDRLIAQRARLYEHIAPVRRAALAVAPGSDVIRGGLATLADEQRREIASVFARELDGPDRRERLAAVEVATSFDAWDHLRRVQGLSMAAAQRAVRRLVAGALGERRATRASETQ